MNKKLKIIFMFIIVFTYLNLVFYIAKNTVNETLEIKKLAISNIEKNSLSYCEKLKEWEVLGDYIFFHRSSAFYFVESSKLLISFVQTINATLAFKVYIYVDENKYPLINNSTILKNHEFHVYTSNSLTLKIPENFFDNSKSNKKFFEHNNIKNVSIIIEDSSSGRKTNNVINVNIKYPFNGVKKFSMMCSKAFYGDTETPEQFDGWFILNKNIGFEKIFLVIIAFLQKIL